MKINKVLGPIASGIKYEGKDFKNSSMLKWCPGCGDYAVFNSLNNAMAQVGVSQDDTVVVSGIGCSSRLPYYMNTYGMHTIHGRGAAVATGVKLANPDLNVWLISGDGDSMAIGGNHFIHMIRRNVGINMVLFNNKVYGLTKGQYSPTSKRGFVSKTSPMGTIEDPFVPAQLVFGARGAFFARTLDVDMELTTKCLVAAHHHPGTSVIEALVNCVIFNNGTHKEYSDRAIRSDKTIVLEHGKPMIYGKDKNKGIILDGLELKSVTIGENGITEKDLLVHDVHTHHPILHQLLASMHEYGDMPLALGVIRDVAAPVYEEELVNQIIKAQEMAPGMSIQSHLDSLSRWVVE